MAARLFFGRRFHSTLRSWTPPQTIPCIADEISGGGGGEGDKRHWLAVCKTNGFEFATEYALFNHYISTLASVIGSKKEAMKKIYLVSIGWRFGFGVEIDTDTKYKLEVNPDIVAVVEDCHYQARNKDPTRGSLDRFIPFNYDHRFNDIFSYHHFSECKSIEKPNHCLIHVKKPDGGFDSEQHTIEFCTKLLANVLGSEKEAKKRIYIVWCKVPFGFAAEIDEETAHKLQGPQVLTVLPDYAFDIKKKDYGVLIISHLSHENSQSRFIESPLHDSDVDDEETDDSEDYEETEDSEDYEETEGGEDYEETEDSEDEEGVEDDNDSEESDLVKATNDSDNYEIAEDAKDSKYSVEEMENSEDEEHVKDANDSEESNMIKAARDS